MTARRTFIAGLGAAAGSSMIWPLAARGQTAERTPRIGYLTTGAEDDPDSRMRVGAFREGLAQLGWVENRNIHIDYRFAAGTPDELPKLAGELAALGPAVIFIQGTPAVLAVQRVSRTIPVVFINVSDPVGSGIVPNLPRPDGNVTGQLLYEDGIVGKWIGMLKEIAPNTSRVIILANPKSTPFEYFLRSARAVAPSLGIELTPASVETLDDVKASIQSLSANANAGLALLPDGTTFFYRREIIALAEVHRLPAVYPLRAFVTDGGLMSYDADLVEQYRQATSYVDRILRGAKPGELPVQTPTKYETVVNLKAAKAIGITVPPTLLVRADEVIE
jgi:putative tryptophan/tyrosine transport system substrate-binding protein